MMIVVPSLLFFLLIATTKALSSNMPPVSKVAVVGSTGQLGRRAVDQLLERKIPVKCLIRQSTPPDFLLEKQTQHPDLLEFVTNGDVTDTAKVKELLQDCSHCLALHGATRRSKWYETLTAAEGSEDSDKSHAKQVNYNSMKTFVQCAQETDCSQIVRITGKGEDPSSFFSILINGLGSMAKGWNYEGEQVLRDQPKENSKHLDYTIIRPGIMKPDFDPNESPVHLKLADNGGDLKVSAVSYDQIAELCIESILQPEAKDTTLTAMNVEGTGPSIVEQLKQVDKDTRNFPTTLIGEHKQAVKKVFRSLAAAFLAVFVGIVSRFF
ncbi:expressed unknown protein [Seminavis robusta]|uniref:NAD(P)-binding domain-containing protein n=1 Tax=Seminavis robusta TaxID=568900 RepID=A0A9N8EPQ1_9STRA|nr:expressed unknown protein [Seminavis robusta]|eukprot:Sro1303_g260980.1 n/a (324) ;mRNA; f:12187-13261